MSSWEEYSQKRIASWEAIAARPLHHTLSGHYQRRLQSIFRQIVAPGARVLELGCGTGDLLAAVQPGYGVGIDFSETMIAQARAYHPELKFMLCDVHELAPTETFDYILLSDLVNDLWDVQQVFERMRSFCHAETRILLNTYSRLWQLPLSVARDLRLATPLQEQNWLTVDDVTALLYLAGFELLRSTHEYLLPLPIPGLDAFCNRGLVRFWPFNQLALANLIIARPLPVPVQNQATVSVIIPARNEAGNIPAIFARIPQMGRGTELVFVEGHSSDTTSAAIETEIRRHPEFPSCLYHQTGKGKGDAVRLGFSQARGEVLMILDADLTVPPEDLPRFYQALVSGKAEMVNGVRLVYPMEKQAMRFANLLGNKFFTYAFSWLLGQPIKDTLCGTKVLWQRDYQRIAANRTYFGDFDPFGDYDLLFGAARLNLKILDLPVRYGERTYGTTNIQRWKHGLLLLRMVAFAARKIKFI
jgi:SAM-dependent methyltransferase